MTPAGAGSLDVAAGPADGNRGGSGAIDTGTKPVNAPSRNCLRQV
jgi:hypothetical protein